ncbi:MAG: chromate transporter [Eubacteriales bacterium]|nr:chromate transporter [Eubacteriales bacterium]
MSTKDKNKKGFYKTLFLSTLKLSAFTFGGGFVIVPLMRKRFVEELKWITEKEMMDLICISQSSPGPIAVNTSLMVGYHLAQLKGALTAALGSILPPFLIISVVSYFYDIFRSNTYVSAAMKGMQAGVAAVIASTVVDLFLGEKEFGGLFSSILTLLAFVAVYFFKVHVLIIFLVCALLSVIKSNIPSKGCKKL